MHFMLKTILVLPVIVSIAGCQADADVRSKSPLESYFSKKTPDQAVSCLNYSLAEHYKAISKQRFTAQTISPGTEYDVVPVDGFVNGHYTYTVNVKPAGTGSHLSIYQGQSMLPSITNSIREGVKNCL